MDELIISSKKFAELRKDIDNAQPYHEYWIGFRGDQLIIEIMCPNPIESKSYVFKVRQVSD